MTETPTPTPPDPSPPRPEGRFGGWLLIVIGALVVVLCGGCTLTIWGVGLVGAGRQPLEVAASSLIGMFVVTGLIGGVPSLGGAILIWAGWRVLHPIRTPKGVAKDFE
jgi:hypothetical protein